jgi:O-antigen/teichoic acid export membrane protein
MLPLTAPRGAIPSVRRNFGWTLSSNVVYAACQWGMLSTLAKTATTEAVGQFAMGLVISAPIMTFFGLQLRLLIATDARRRFEFSSYLGVSAVGATIGFAICLAAASWSGLSPQTWLIVVAVSLAKVIDTVTDAFHGLLQQRERLDAVAVSITLRGFLGLLLFGGAALVTRNSMWASAGLPLASAAVLLTYTIPRANSLFAPESLGAAKLVRFAGAIRPRFSVRELRLIAMAGLPLALVGLFGSLTINVPRYFIGQLLGESQLGIFAAMAYVVLAGNMIAGALAHAASARLARLHAANARREFLLLVTKLLAVGGVLGVIGVTVAYCFGQQLLSLLYRPEYGEFARVFVWLMVAGGLMYPLAFLGAAATAMRRQTALAAIQFIHIMFLAGISLKLIQRYQLLGAALSLVGGAAFLSVSYAICVFSPSRQFRTHR